MSGAIMHQLISLIQWAGRGGAGRGGAGRGRVGVGRGRDSSAGL